jgi:hypothetical protein
LELNSVQNRFAAAEAVEGTTARQPPVLGQIRAVQAFIRIQFRIIGNRLETPPKFWSK